MTRHFFTIEATAPEDLASIYRLALEPFDDATLQGQGVALVFQLASLRTRASSATAVAELGGFATFFGDDEIGIDRRESAEDIARTLSQMYAIAALRVRSHAVFERMRGATNDTMAMINLLSDLAHPCQAVADVLTLAEHFGGGDATALRGKRVAYVGDATNVTRSLAVALLRLGVDVHVGAPEGYQLTPGGVEDPFAVTGGGTLRLFDNPVDAVTDVDAVYTDTWISMGMEAEAQVRIAALGGFQVTTELLSHANNGCVVLHCLPAHRGEEITDEVLDSDASLIWRQVFHRRTAMLGILRWIKGEQ